MRRLGLAVLASLVLLAGCGEKKEDKPQEPTRPTPNATEVRPQVSEALAGSFAGKWTRDSGQVFNVEDDLTTIKGTLAEDPKGVFESYTFSLHREGDALVGKAQIKTKDGIAGETSWTLNADGQGLRGNIEVLAVDPDSNELLPDMHPTELHTFSVERPKPPEPPKEQPKAPEGEAPKDQPKAPEGEAPKDQPKAPEGEAPKDQPKAPEGEAPKDQPKAPEGEAPKDQPKAPEGEAPK